MYIPTDVQKQPQINAAISAVERELSPWVKRIRYSIGEDWSGDWAIFFRVLITDDAAQRKLKEVASQVVWRTSKELDSQNVGLFSYFDFRSESEQARRREPAWE